ncbi:IclR family transcriptional regulator [Virgibacillus byunsanensis]|uniref:IclR family transcriptional regulator n=1 Tax=Virgibacillus byunsanensis TaxID=570945 RepID=A0ABW3LHP2_9BACI
MSQNKYQIPSIHKAINVLELLKQQESLTLKEIKQELDMPISTCYNILTTLENRGFVQRSVDTGHYSLGMTLMHFGLFIYNNIDFKKMGKHYLGKLSEEFGETAYLSIIDKSSFKGLVIERHQGDRTGLVYSRNTGDTFPIYASGTGKSLMSGLSEDELQVFFEKTEMISYTSNTITDEETLREEIKEIIKEGYAISISAYEDNVISVSSPISDSLGRVIASVSLVGPINRIDPMLDKVIYMVKKTAMDISKEIGYQ